MTQSEVLNHLRKHPTKWFTIEELAEVFDKSTSSIGRNLRMLLEDHLVFTKLRPTGGNYSYYWRIKS
jgi:predicted transcriptional regulator